MGFREARKEAKVGLQEAADALGVSKQAVNAWERGVAEPGIDSLRKMAEMYNTSVDALLRKDAVPPQT